LDKAVMQQLRDLAYDGRTVVVVTHSMANLDTCDWLLVLAPGGKMAFYGPPGEALRYFGLPGWAEVFQAFDHYPGRDWAAEFAESPAYAEWVELQRPKQATQPNELQPPSAPPPQQRGRLRQTSSLTRRYARVIAADRGYLLFMGLLQRPAVAAHIGKLAARRGLYYRAGGGLLATHLDAPAPPRPPSPPLTSVAGRPPDKLTRAATGSACRAGRGGCIPRPAAATSACWHCAGLTRVSSTKWPS
jgi:hypothetical protein